MALAGLFCALDGINEKGLAIADLTAGDSIQTHQRTSKPDLLTSTAIRYLLNHAANVGEALKLLNSIDMHSEMGFARHYAIADASGRSVVVEYVDNKMVVTESPAVANHYLCEQKRNVGLTEGDDRYERLCQRYGQTGGVMSEKQLTEAIEAVSQPQREGFLGTAWTMVMNLKHPSVTYYSRRHFDKPLQFTLSRTN
jgi:predicted choloylglycine hydrolase